MSEIPSILNTTLAEVDTEYPISIGKVETFTFQCRTAVDVRFAFVTGKVATSTAPYATLKAGQSYEMPRCDLYRNPDLTLYVATSSNTDPIVEVVKVS